MTMLSNTGVHLLMQLKHSSCDEVRGELASPPSSLSFHTEGDQSALCKAGGQPSPGQFDACTGRD